MALLVESHNFHRLVRGSGLRAEQDLVSCKKTFDRIESPSGWTVQRCWARLAHVAPPLQVRPL
jgi:hypothetical protein